MSQIGIFGGGGFIGSHLSRRLAEQGKELVIVDVTNEKIPDLVENPQVNFRELDVRAAENDDVCSQIVKESEIVIDLIAYANPQEYVDMPLEVVELNYDQNLEIVEDCVETNTRLIQFSTCEVYGKLGNRTGDDVVFSEDSSDLVMGPVQNHRWIYAAAKQLLERMVHAHGIENALDWTIVRPFNFIGPEMDYIIESPDEGTPRVFASFMSALLYDHPMYLVNGGTNRRAFTSIRDAVAATELIIENYGDKFTNEIVNIGTPENEVSIREFANLMREVYQDLSPDGRLPELDEISGDEFYGEGYEDCERRVPDIQKLKDAGWEPEDDIRSTLEYAMSYYIDIHERGIDERERRTGSI